MFGEKRKRVKKIDDAGELVTNFLQTQLSAAGLMEDNANSGTEQRLFDPYALGYIDAAANTVCIAFDLLKYKDDAVVYFNGVFCAVYEDVYGKEKVIEVMKKVSELRRTGDMAFLEGAALGEHEAKRLISGKKAETHGLSQYLKRGSLTVEGRNAEDVTEKAEEISAKAIGVLAPQMAISEELPTTKYTMKDNWARGYLLGVLDEVLQRRKVVHESDAGVAAAVMTIQFVVGITRDKAEEDYFECVGLQDEPDFDAGKICGGQDTWKWFETSESSPCLGLAHYLQNGTKRQ